jgi:hypothetical protein
MTRILALAYLALVAGWIWLVFNTGAVFGQTNPNCTEFGFQISTSCCCSAGCCAEANDGEFKHIGGDEYESTVTKQRILRTGWSPDGRTIKCACDFIEGKWTKHPGAKVNCLFLPMPSS